MARHSSKQKTHITVILCTIGRANSLKNALKYIEKLKYPNFDLVVVQNGPSAETTAVLAHFKEHSKIHCRVVQEDRRGLSFARNRGVLESTGEILAFTDDDCYVATDWLDRIAEAFKDPDVGFVGGRVLLFNPEDAPIAIQLSETHKIYRPERYVTAGEIHGANMSFRRRVFDRIGGFDTRLGAGRKLCPEDSDALNRAAAAGFTGVYDPRVVVSHHHGRRGEAAAAMDKVYALGRGALMMKILLGHCTWRQKIAPFKPFLGNIKRTPIYIIWESIGALQFLKLALEGAYHRDREDDVAVAASTIKTTMVSTPITSPPLAKHIE